jgi:2-polyprenyl-6-methoxyphenol hydroxylase-like FAD-dependent oxidoreductase
MTVHAAIIGAGPTGFFLGLALARRGHQVSIIDRDPGLNRTALAAPRSHAVSPCSSAAFASDSALQAWS